MSNDETAFCVTGRLTVDYQIVVQAKHPDEAAYFASDIDLDKWSESGSDWEILDVSKNYFLRRIKVFIQRVSNLFTYQDSAPLHRGSVLGGVLLLKL